MIKYSNLFSTSASKATVCSVLIFCAFVSASAQDLTRSDARIAYNNQEYDIAIKNFRKVIAQNPNDGESWHFLGLSLLNIKNYDEAITAFTAALKVKFVPYNCYYNIACAYANKGNTDDALKFLEKSTKAGYVNTARILADDDMVSLLENERFKKIINDANNPTANSPNVAIINAMSGNWEEMSNSDSGQLTWSSSLSGFSQSIDLVIGTRRALNLLLSYWGKSKSWIVNGADAWGGTYSGPISITKNTIFIPDDAGGAKKRSIEFTFIEPLVVKVTFNEYINGVWTIKRQYRLEPKSQ